MATLKYFSHIHRTLNHQHRSFVTPHDLSYCQCEMNCHIQDVIVSITSKLMIAGFFLICILIEILTASCAMPSIKMQKFDPKTNECRLCKNIFPSMAHLQRQYRTKMQFAYHRFYNELIKGIPVEIYNVLKNL